MPGLLTKITRLLECVYSTLGLTIMLVASKFFPSMKARMTSHMGQVMYDTPFKVDDYADSVYNFHFVKAIWRSRYLDCFKEAFLGGKAPDATVVNLRTNQVVNLLDIQAGGRPLVLNFGSCT